MSFFPLSLLLSFILTLLIRHLALRYKVVDKPDEERKHHPQPTPLLGGVAIFLAFWICVIVIWYFSGIGWKSIYPVKLIGVMLGSIVIVVMGWLDDVKKLGPKIRLLITALAALLAVGGGVSLSGITNPFGGMIELGQAGIALSGIGTISVVGSVIVFLWLMGMMYTTKILDGLDGLSAGITAIGALMIFLLASSKDFFQADTRLLSLTLLGVCLGFLLLNFYPAKIFLGESGSLFLGYILGVLAVIAGGKIATALLVMAVPILDLARVIWARARRGQPIFQGDREHLHFRLVDAGLSHRQAVLTLYAIAFAFGITTLFLPSTMKLVMLGALGVAMIGVEAILIKDRKT